MQIEEHDQDSEAHKCHNQFFNLHKYQDTTYNWKTLIFPQLLSRNKQKVNSICVISTTRSTQSQSIFKTLCIRKKEVSNKTGDA